MIINKIRKHEKCSHYIDIITSSISTWHRVIRTIAPPSITLAECLQYFWKWVPALTELRNPVRYENNPSPIDTNNPTQTHPPKHRLFNIHTNLYGSKNFISVSKRHINFRGLILQKKQTMTNKIRYFLTYSKI